MPEISRFYGIVIQMYTREHNPPHFHARYGSYRAQISIDSGDVSFGLLPPSAARLVKDWAALHRQELQQNWDLLRAEQPARSIAPLE
ncbi:MAG TPA: DUF4160 domain-containing protein [Tepidisphaeraceae bacterium]|jgi:hypothetical protein